MLAIQFSKTEHIPGFENRLESEPLTVAESRRLPGCVRGEWIYAHFPAPSRRFRRFVTVVLLDRGALLLHLRLATRQGPPDRLAPR